MEPAYKNPFFPDKGIYLDCELLQRPAFSCFSGSEEGDDLPWLACRMLVRKREKLYFCVLENFTAWLFLDKDPKEGDTFRFYRRKETTKLQRRKIRKAYGADFALLDPVKLTAELRKNNPGIPDPGKLGLPDDPKRFLERYFSDLLLSYLAPDKKGCRDACPLYTAEKYRLVKDFLGLLNRLSAENP